MRVTIGKYKNGQFGPYHIADWFKLVGAGEDRCEAIGDRLNKTWLKPFCEWIEQYNPFRHRKVKIRIDEWDTWNMNDTLTQIIAPMLRQLRKDHHGGTAVENEDVPENLRNTVAPDKEMGENIDAFYFARWDWVLDEMIWAFEQLEGDGDWTSQFETGVHDVEWKKDGDEHLDSKTGQMLHRMQFVEGPNHTYRYDNEGSDNHLERMKNGYRLFGKYYMDLWD